MNCRRAEQLLSRQLDSRLPDREEQALRAHLPECPACRRLAAMARRWWRLSRRSGSFRTLWPAVSIIGAAAPGRSPLAGHGLPGSFRACSPGSFAHDGSGSSVPGDNSFVQFRSCGG